MRCPGQGAPSAREMTIGPGSPPPERADRGRIVDLPRRFTAGFVVDRLGCYRRWQPGGAIWGIAVEMENEISSETETVPPDSGRILIVGGYGQVGLSIAERLAPLFSGRVTVAGRNFDKASVHLPTYMMPN